MPNIRLIQYGVVMGTIVALIAVAHMRGRHNVQVLWDADKAATELVIEKMNTVNAKREAELRESVAVATATMKEGIQNAENAYSRTIDGLRTGNLKLRKSFNTCANTLSAVAADPAGVPARPAGGFNDADAGVAFRIAADGDRGIAERNACAAILRRERAVLEREEVRNVDNRTHTAP
jgi:hypothetical protein